MFEPEQTTKKKHQRRCVCESTLKLIHSLFSTDWQCFSFHSFFRRGNKKKGHRELNREPRQGIASHTLSIVQRLACLCITETMRTCPTCKSSLSKIIPHLTYPKDETIRKFNFGSTFFTKLRESGLMNLLPTV